VQAYSIFTRTLERYTILVMARAHNIRAIYQARQRRDNTPSNRLIQRSNRMIGPSSELNDEARLTMSALMAKRLKIAGLGLEHIDKNIPLTPQQRLFKKKKKIFCRFATLRHGDTSVPDGLSR
jgi:hypothetical protein